jgi:hypothetical protein
MLLPSKVPRQEETNLDGNGTFLFLWAYETRPLFEDMAFFERFKRLSFHPFFA